MSKIEKTGEVISKKGPKTLIVIVKRTKTHPIYRKKFTVSKKFAVHDAKDQFEEGDVVTIRAVRPFSKNKRFIAVDKLGRADMKRVEIDAPEGKNEDPGNKQDEGEENDTGTD